MKNSLRINRAPMAKKKFTYSLLKTRWLMTIIAILTLGIGNVWGGTHTWSYTFASGNLATSAGNKTFSGKIDGSTTKQVTWACSAATAINWDNNKGIQIGTGNNPQKNSAWTMSTAVSNIGSNIKITKISAYLSVANSGGGKYIFSAGSASSGSNGTTFNNTSATNKEYSIPSGTTISSGNIVISLQSTTNKAMYIKSVTITYEDVSSTPVDPTITPTNGEVEVGHNLDVSTLFESNSSGAMTYSITAGGSYASLSGSTLTGTAIGSVTIQASQAAATGYNAKTATCTVNVIPELSTITITQNEIANFTNSYAQYDWTAGGVSGKIYAYKNSGMQLNSGQSGYYVYNTDPIPGKIRKITMTKASGTTRSWTPYVSTSALTSTSGGTALTAKSVESTTTWDVTGDNTYFYLTLSGGATVIGSIVIYYEGCNQLASINGSITLSNDGCTKNQLKATWKTNSTGLSGIASQVLHVFKASDDSEVEGLTGLTGLTASTSNQTVTISGLQPCTEYYVRVENISAGGSNCGDGWAGEKSSNATTIGHALVLGETDGEVYDDEALMGVYAITGSPSNACAGATISLDYSEEDGYHFESWNVFKTGTPATKVAVTNKQFTMPAYDVTVSAVFAANTSPTLTVKDGTATNEITSLACGEQEINTSSSAKTIKLFGENLEGNVTWALSGADASYFAVTPASPITQANAEVVGGQAVEITFSPNTARNFSATLTFSSSNAADKVITLSGTGVNLYTVTLNLGGGNGLASTTGWTEDNGTWKQKQVSNGASITLPNATLSSALSGAGWSFAGWKTSAVSTQTSDDQSFENTTYTPESNITLYAVYQYGDDGAATDVLTRETTGVADQTGGTVSYTEWSGKTGTSGAVYAGNSAGDKNSIQLRSTNNAGIITTTSGGNATKVTVTWNNGTTEDRTLNVYGKNTAYEAVADLYDNSKRGTLIGTIVKGTSTVLNISTDYAYIGMCSNSGAMYLDEIDIDWSTASLSYFSNPSSAVTLTYDANGATAGSAPAVENYTMGNEVTVAAQPEGLAKTGHTFAGWNTKADGTGTNYVKGSAQESFTINKSTTLYANWTKNNYTVVVASVDNTTITATPAGASAIAESANASVAYGTEVTLANSDATHFTFDEWDVYETGNSSNKVTVSDGKFTVPAFNVTVSATAPIEDANRLVQFFNNGVQIGEDQKVYVGDAPEAPTATYADCFNESTVFKGWATAEWDNSIDALGGKTVYAGELPAVAETGEAIPYYAVWAKPGEGSKFVRVQTLSDLNAATKIAIVNAYSSKHYILTTDLATAQSAPTAVEGKYTFSDGQYWTLEKASTNWKFKNGGNYLKADATPGSSNSEKEKTISLGESGNITWSISNNTYTSNGTPVFTVANAVNGTTGLEYGNNGWCVYYNTNFNGSYYTMELYVPEVTYSEYRTKCCTDGVMIAAASATNGTFTIKQSETNVVGQKLNTCTSSQVVSVACTPALNYHVTSVTQTGVDAEYVEISGSNNAWTITFAQHATGTSTIAVAFAKDEDPSISTSTDNIAFGDVVVGSTQTFDLTVGATNLTGSKLELSCDNNNFSLSEDELTISEGTVSATTVTVTLNTSDIGGQNGTITISDGTTSKEVSVSATVKNQYTINWYVNGVSQAESATYLDGATITKPEDPESCDASISFMGWTTAAIVGKQADAPAILLAASDITTATANADYYAVFAKAGETTWTETALADLTSEDVFVIANNGDSYLAMTNDNGTTHPLAISVTVENNKITSEVANNLKWNVSGNATDGYTFYPNGDNTKWLYCSTTASSGSNDNMKVGTGERKVFEWNNGWLRTKDSNTTRYVSLYTTTPDWRGYINTTTAPTNMVFFKYASTASKDYMTTCSVVFSVIYKAGEGTGEDYIVNNIAKNASHTVLSNDDTNFSKTGYHFIGWKLGDADYEAGDEIEHVTADLTFVAQWEVTTFTMSYSANGGTVQAGKEALENESVNEGDSYTVKDNVFEKEGKLFTGWKVGNVDYAEGAVFTPTGNMEFVAQWTDKATCALTLVVNGEVQTPINIPQGEESNIELSPAAVGEYTFVGWAETPETADVESITTMLAYTPVANEMAKTLYAVYTRTETGATVTDVLTAADLAATGTSYVEFSDVQKISAAKYAGKTAKNGENIQINEKSKQGIYSTVSAGELVSVTIEMNSATKKLGVYGSNDGFTGYASIPSQEGVTKIEDFASVTSKTVTPISAYKYVGITSSEDGAKQISSISITWQSKTTYYTTAPGELRSVAYNLGTTPAGAWKENEGCADTHVKSGLTYDICEDEPVREGFNFDGWTVTGGTLTGNTITIGNSDVEISAKWVAKAQSNLIYSDGAETPATVVVENVEEGTVVTMPTVGTEEGQINLSKSGYDFKGWMYDGHLYKAGETFIMPAEAATLIAQWKKQNVEKMTLVTSMDQLVNGSKVVIAYNDDDSNKDCVAADISGKFLTTTSASFADNSVTYAEASAVEFTLEVADGGWKLRKDADNYLAVAANGDLSWATFDNASVWAISISATRTTIISNSKYLQYNYNGGTDPRMKGYAGAQGDVLLYTKMTNVTSNETLSNIGYSEGDVIVVDNNSTLTIDNNVAPTNVTVKPGSKVIVDSEKKVDANSVIVEKGATLEINGSVEADEPLVFYTTLGKGTGTKTDGNAPGSSTQIIHAGNLTAHSDVYIEIELTQDAKASSGWYAFSVPFPVDAMNGVYYKDTKLTNEVGYAIMSYHGDLRAQGQYGWKKYRGIMQPGELYIITVADTDYKTLRFKKAAGADLEASDQVAVKKYALQEGGSTGDNGWNGLGNPNLQVSYYGSGYMHFLDHGDNAFKQRTGSNINLVVGSAFFIQYGGSDGDITIHEGLQEGANGYLAPARNKRGIENTIHEVKIFKGDKEEDNVFLTTSEDATNSYETGKDVAKLSMGAAKCAQMSIPAYGTNLCAADFPLVNNKVSYPLTITTPAEGNYRIETAETYEDATIYLTYNGRVIWNLSMSPYELELQQGQNSGYGLRIVAAPQTPTDIENTDALNDANGVQKLIIDEHVYILRGEQLFDVTGKAVK